VAARLRESCSRRSQVQPQPQAVCMPDAGAVLTIMRSEQLTAGMYVPCIVSCCRVDSVPCSLMYKVALIHPDPGFANA
jgi:hypothetical protein